MSNTGRKSRRRPQRKINQNMKEKLLILFGIVLLLLGAERPVVFISLANPYHLVDVPMIKTFINGYSNSEYVIDSVMEKLMGRSNFTGKSPVDPFCGKEYLKW